LGLYLTERVYGDEAVHNQLPSPATSKWLLIVEVGLESASKGNLRKVMLLVISFAVVDLNVHDKTA
jgi:hypothetical protein